MNSPASPLSLNAAMALWAAWIKTMSFPQKEPWRVRVTWSAPRPNAASFRMPPATAGRAASVLVEVRALALGRGEDLTHQNPPQHLAVGVEEPARMGIAICDSDLSVTPGKVSPPTLRRTRQRA